MSRPPKLPSIPSYPGATARPASPAAAPPVVQYVRPAPIVIVKHHLHGDDAHAADREGHDD